MWKTLSHWLLALLNMSRELEENRASIRRLEERMRETEEAIKLLALEQRHTRELESSEREKLLLRLQQELSRLKEALPRGKKN
jgi:hypothetical protein